MKGSVTGKSPDMTNVSWLGVACHGDCRAHFLEDSTHISTRGTEYLRDRRLAASNSEESSSIRREEKQEMPLTWMDLRK